jgi:hypothetical protein
MHVMYTLLAEFREIDSYLTESEDEAYEELEDARPTLAQKEFDNSVLLMDGHCLPQRKSILLKVATKSPGLHYA